MTYHLAVDIGASSGRHMLGWIEDGVLRVEEVYRFENGLVERDGSLCWDVDRLTDEIVRGLRRCGESGRVPESVAIDTWGVDFVLVDAAGERVGEAVAYRDGRTAGVPERVDALIPWEELYARTGLSRQSYNTIYQLTALRERHPEQLRRAKHLLMMPDYFVYRLTGQVVCEYTEVTTTGLIAAAARDWDRELLRRLSLPDALFLPVSAPGTRVGALRPEIAAQVGFQTTVVLAASHDTASAVMAVPSHEEDTLYISSGTWSLMGIEQPQPLCTAECRASGFSNEGGFGGRICVLQNIMGLWMVQSVRRQAGGGRSFPELSALAEAADIPSVVDVCDERFLAPADMAAEVAAACADSGQPVPHTLGETLAVIYQSLAHAYADATRRMERMTGRHYPRIHIIGGGSRDTHLNRLTARAAGRPVTAGPVEATAIGNLCAQLLAADEVPDLAAARALVARSFAVETVSDT